MPNVLDHLFGGNTPAGLLTPDGLQRARRTGLLNAGIGMMAASENHGLAGTLAAGLQQGQRGYEDSAVATQDAQAQEQARQQATRRQQILAGMQPQAGETQDQLRARLTTMLTALIQMGDHEGARSVAEVLKSMGGSQAQQPGTWMSVPGPDGKPMRRYVTADEAGAGIAEYQAPAAAPRPPTPRPVTLVNPATGKPELAWVTPGNPTPQFTGHRPASISGPSEGERKAFALLQMIEPVRGILDSADAPNRIEMLARERRLGEVLRSEQQQNDIAGRTIMDAYLRLTTGAAYNANEMNNTHVMLVPMPGDAPGTLALKRKMRQALIRALEVAAGRARAQAGSGTNGTPSLDQIASEIQIGDE